INEKLSAADPTNVENRLAVIRSIEFAGYALWGIGDLTGDPQNYREAFEYFRKNRDMVEALYATEPNRFRRRYADVLMAFGTEQWRLGDTTAGLETCRQGLALFEQIAASDPNNIEAQRDLGDSHRN